MSEPIREHDVAPTPPEPVDAEKGLAAEARQLVPVKDLKPEPVLERLGQKTVIVLFLTVIVQLIALAFIGWLMYGSIENKTWHSIVVNGWSARAITLTSLALRTAVALQGAVCLSMLAAITLERVALPLDGVANISFVTAGVKTDPFSIIGGFVTPMLRHDPLIRKGKKKRFRWFILMFVLAVLTTVTLAQFASTALLGDLSIQTIPGREEDGVLAYDYPFTNNKPYASGETDFITNSDGKTTYGYTYPKLPTISYWQTKTPTSWPVFAEYSEPPPENLPKGVSDTGVSLRAFLPYVRPELRQTIRNFTGKAVVMDTRVSCQKPVIANKAWTGMGQNTFNGFKLAFGRATGYISNTTEAPGWISFDSRFKNGPGFSCIGATTAEKDVAIWTVCQIPTLDEDWLLGKVARIKSDPLQYQASSGLKSSLKSSDQPQNGANWVVMSFINATDPEKSGVPLGDDSPYAIIQTSGVSIAMTLCATSNSAAERTIEAYSDRNRTEPTTTWDAESLSLDISSITNQLDTGYLTLKPKGKKLLSAEERGILQLKGKTDWVEKPKDATILDGPDQFPFVAGGTTGLKLPESVKNFNPKNPLPDNLWLAPWIIQGTGIAGGIPDSGGYSKSWAAVLASNVTLRTESSTTGVLTSATNAVTAQDWIADIFQYFKETPAVAVQAILTSVAGIAYYDRITQYTKSDKVQQVFFITTDSPGGPYGQKRTHPANGFIAVVVLLLLHLTFVAWVLFKFIREAKVTRIHDVWQAVSQFSQSSEFRPILNVASDSNGRKAVDGLVQGGEQVHVRLGGYGNSTRFEKQD